MSDSPTAPEHPAHPAAPMVAAAPAAARPLRESWRSRRVLITGHTGFKGAWLALWLHSLGAQVSGLSDGIPTHPSLFELAGLSGDIHSIEGDIRDPDAVAAACAACRPEVIIHMAAQSLVRRSLADPRTTFQTNVLGTLNVLEAARTQPDLRVLINVTSDKCYENDDGSRDRGFREHDPLGGRDPYSSSKACSELLSAAYRDSFLAAPDGPRLATARAGNVIGGGDWAADRLVPDIVRAALAGESVQIRNPTAVRPWQHVLAPLSGYLLLAQALWDSAEHAGAWNFGPDAADARPVGWIAQRLAADWPGGPLHVEIDPGPHPQEAHTLMLDSSKARTQLRWRPVWNLADALDAILEWYGRLHEHADMREATLRQIEAFEEANAADR